YFVIVRVNYTRISCVSEYNFGMSRGTLHVRLKYFTLDTTTKTANTGSSHHSV
ncbi:hypothetical protein EWB00_002321, partial [Schistosoma japonicum]